jgi:hypothetical protein
VIAIHPLEDCGNSPKNRLVHDFCLCFLLAASGDRESETFRENKHLLELYESYPDEMPKKKPYVKIAIKSAVSHGKIGAVEFDAIDSAHAAAGGCIVVEFQSAAAKKIVRVTEYAK